ncbi:MAG: hypothetical protein NZ920_04965 [Aigarchaeota archaeon]|nr:hypothetical protein [Aigarchaeota archaeon]MDW8093286.1 hypothetical protein [Nitrososphaerota archaeon]
MEKLEKIANLTPYSRGVNLIAKVVSRSDVKTVGSKFDQKQHQVAEFLIADETGAISLVLWDDNVGKVGEGDTIKVSNAFIKVFRGKMQLNIGRYGSLERYEGDIEEVNVENNLSDQQVRTERRYGGGFRGRRERFNEYPR